MSRKEKAAKMTMESIVISLVVGVLLFSLLMYWLTQFESCPNCYKRFGNSTEFAHYNTTFVSYVNSTQKTVDKINESLLRMDSSGKSGIINSIISFVKGTFSFLDGLYQVTLTTIIIIVKSVFFLPIFAYNLLAEIGIPSAWSVLLVGGVSSIMVVTIGFGIIKLFFNREI